MNLVHYGKYRGVEVAITEGDIRDAEVECVAVSGNTQGMMGGGVSGAVRDAAGLVLEQDCQRMAPIQRGKSVILNPYNLSRKGIKAIGYASIMNKPINSTNNEVITGAVLHLLQSLESRGISSVALPLMGSGVGRLPAKVSASAIIKAVEIFLRKDPNSRVIKRVVLSGYSRREAASFIVALDLLFRARLGKSAIVIIDMVESFVGNGTLITEAQAESIMGNINMMLDIAADHDMPIFYVKDVHDATDRELVYVHQHCIAEPSAIVFHPKLKIHDGSKAIILNKRTYSAFFQTDLAERLRELGCETIIFLGTQTHVCVKYSALHAMMHGFRPIVLADCTISSTEQRHENGLEEIARYIGEVSYSTCLSNALSESMSRGT